MINIFELDIYLLVKYGYRICHTYVFATTYVTYGHVPGHINVESYQSTETLGKPQNRYTIQCGTV
jgi:hypothetical protein